MNTCCVAAKSGRSLFWIILSSAIFLPNCEPDVSRRKLAPAISSQQVNPQVSAVRPELSIVMPAATPSDPPGPAGDIKEEVQSFTTLDACIRKHNQDSLVSDGLEALGHDQFLTDMCRIIEATKKKDAVLCTETLGSAIRQRCERTVASFHGEPGYCPKFETRQKPFHDPFCLAVSRRDVRPCAALCGFEKVTCEAVVAHDVARCGNDNRCIRQVQRWQNVLPSVTSQSPYQSRASVDLRSVDKESPNGVYTENVELPFDAAAGAVLIKKKNQWSILFGTLTPLLRSELANGGVYFELSGASPSSEYTLSERQSLARLRLPAGVDYDLPLKTTVHLKIDKFDTEPYGVLKFTAEFEMAQAAISKSTLWKVDTWIRDIVEER